MNTGDKETQQASTDRPQTQESNVDNSSKKRYEIKVEGDDSEPSRAPEGTRSEPPTIDDMGETLNTGTDDPTLQRLLEAEETVARHKDDLLRVQAEMQNLRRRTEQDIEKAHKYGQERLVSELLNVVDNLERALDAAGEEGTDDSAGPGGERLKAIREGVELTLKSFRDCFSKFSIETIDPLGEPFDPQRHEAMATVQDDNVEPNTVTAVVQKGYLLHGRVIRPARVMVSR